MKLLGFKIPGMIMNLCTPAQVYLALSLINILVYLISMSNVNNKVLEAEPEGGGIHHYTGGGLVVNILFTIVWICLLNYICKFKYGKNIAWFIVLLPFFFMGLIFVGLVCAVSFIALQTSKNKILKSEVNGKGSAATMKKTVYKPDGNKPVGNKPVGNKPEPYVSELLR